MSKDIKKWSDIAKDFLSNDILDEVPQFGSRLVGEMKNPNNDQNSGFRMIRESAPPDDSNDDND